MKRFLVSLLVFLALLPGAGCNNDTLASNFNLVSNDSTYDAAAVAIAVDAAGWKHVVWSECSATDHCRIVYTKFLFSRPQVFTYIDPKVPANYSYQDPDIAVTASGTAYIVFRMKKIADGTFNDCYNIPSVDTDCNVLPHIFPIPESRGLPHIAARGEVVYIVNEVPDNSGTALLYQQLKPWDHSYGMVGGLGSNVVNTDADLAISGDGTLHVVWRNLGAPKTVHYNDNYHTTGDMSHSLVTGSSQLTAPRIACDGATDNSGYCYMAYGDTASASNTLTMHYCLVSNCTIGGIVSVDLSSNPTWVLHGNLALAAAGAGSNSTAYLAFAAYNAQSPTVSQVFGLSWVPGNAAPVPSLLTSPAASYPYEKNSPLIIPITGDLGGSPFTSGVTAWRNGYSWSNAAFDAYLWDSANQVRKVFTSYHSPAADSLSTFDLAGNGTLAGGVWVDEQSSRSTRKVPWVSLNLIPVYLPAILR